MDICLGVCDSARTEDGSVASNLQTEPGSNWLLRRRIQSLAACLSRAGTNRSQIKGGAAGRATSV